MTTTDPLPSRRGKKRAVLFRGDKGGRENNNHGSAGGDRCAFGARSSISSVVKRKGRKKREKSPDKGSAPATSVCRMTGCNERAPLPTVAAGRGEKRGRRRRGVAFHQLIEGRSDNTRGEDIADRMGGRVFK